jgi:hypothetical protein
VGLGRKAVAVMVAAEGGVAEGVAVAAEVRTGKEK